MRTTNKHYSILEKATMYLYYKNNNQIPSNKGMSMIERATLALYNRENPPKTRKKSFQVFNKHFTSKS